jgi:hypothetical protein
MSKRVNIFLDDIEERNLGELLKRYGGKAPGYFHILLKKAYEKEFGGYKSGRSVIKSIKEELTDEQYCELFGGKVGKSPRDGTPLCIKGAFGVPLGDRDRIRQRFGD